MIILGIILSILIILIGVFQKDEEDMYIFGIIGGIFLSICIIGLIKVSIGISSGMIIDDKIAMYSDENDKIEEQMQTIVKDYKDYESTTLEKFANESPTVLISLFPELKTNDLVNKQMDIYLSNNNKIKELKEQKLDISISKWWLYFGK